MTKSRKGKWRDRTIEKLNRAESPTVFPGQEDIQKGVSPSDQPQFDVFEVKLKGKDDQPILISGNTGAIELQVSLLKAIDQLLEIRGTGGGTQGYKSDSISFIGLPKVVLYFKELSSDVEPGYLPLQSRISFRIVDKTDNPNSSLEKITNADIKNLATKIKSIFVEPILYKIHKGKETVSIKDKSRGYEAYIHVYSKNDGIELFTKICQIQGHTIDLRKVFHKTTLDDVGAYPVVEPSITVLGKIVKPDRLRPVGFVHFRDAKLFLSKLDTPIKLCDDKGFVFNGLD